MKKQITLFLSMALCVSLCACGADNNGAANVAAATPLEVDTVNEVEDYADITLVRILTSDGVLPSMPASSYFPNNNAGETFVDVVFDVVNTSDTSINSENFMTASATNASGTEYIAKLYCVETEGMTCPSQFYDLSPLTTNRFHAAISVPEDEQELTLKFEIGGQLFSYDYQTGTAAKNTTAIHVGDTIECEDFAAIKFNGCEFTDVVLPSDTSGRYHYVEVENPDNTYLVAKFNIANYQTTSKEIDTFVGVTATFLDKYNYSGFIYGEDPDKVTGGLDRHVEIFPLSVENAYYIIEVPKTVADKEFTLNITFDGKEYSYAG